MNIDLSNCPTKVVDGQTLYYYLGTWMTKPEPIDVTTNKGYLMLSVGTKNYTNEDFHTFASSPQAMIEGFYKIINVREELAEGEYDYSGRFIADVHFKYKEDISYIDPDGTPALFVARLNPLFNKYSIGKSLSGTILNLPWKTLANFINYFLNCEIHLEKIELTEDPRYNSKVYKYTWRYL